MPVMDISIPDVTLKSRWQCVRHYPGGKPYYAFKEPNMPTYVSSSNSVQYALPSGANIKSAIIWASFSSPFTGYSVLNVNGNSFKHSANGERGADVSLNSTEGTVTLKFNFKANGNKVDEVAHISTITIRNIRLVIDYDEPVSVAPAWQPEVVSNAFSVPPQSVAIYNQSNGKLYMFDGVLKIQHTFSVKIEEEPEKHKDEFVNNARNEPDKLSLDVMMSDVYSDESNMTISSGWDDAAQETAYNSANGKLINLRNEDGSWTRSGNAVYVLNRLKRDRVRLSVITPQYVHVNMIIANITINQDDATPFGWQGQIDFQHAYDPVPEKETNTSKSSSGTPPSESISASITNKNSKGSSSGVSTSNVSNAIKSAGNFSKTVKNSLGSFINKSLKK